MQRFIQKLLLESFNQIWVYNSIRNIGENKIQLRNHLQIQPQHSYLAKLDLYPLYNFPKIWESFPDHQIKILHKNSEFDKKLKQYFINDLSDTVDCGRLLCPACIAGPTYKNIIISDSLSFCLSSRLVLPGLLHSLPNFFLSNERVCLGSPS